MKRQKEEWRYKGQGVVFWGVPSPKHELVFKHHQHTHTFFHFFSYVVCLCMLPFSNLFC
jgi:hypothetical protein